MLNVCVRFIFSNSNPPLKECRERVRHKDVYDTGISFKYTVMRYFKIYVGYFTVFGCCGFRICVCLNRATIYIFFFLL